MRACHLGFQCSPDLPDDFSSSRSRDVSKVNIRLPGLFHSTMKLFGCRLTWTSDSSAGLANGTRTELTDATRAKTSPVVGQTLSKTSPVPPQSPSYTPGSSVVVGMSRADKTAEALLDNVRTRHARCAVCSRDRNLDRIISTWQLSSALQRRSGFAADKDGWLYKEITRRHATSMSCMAESRRLLL